MRVFVMCPVLLAACVAAEPEVSVEAGAVAFQQDCAACHGTDARGAGGFGRELLTEPPDLTRLSRRNGGAFPMDYVLSTIDGFSRGAHFSAAMPEFGAGDMGEPVMTEADGLATPVPARLLSLALYLEAIQRGRDQ